MSYPGYERDQVFRRMAVNRDDLLTLMDEGELREWIDDNPSPNYTGYNAVAYLPSHNRAVWITNGDPVWFDASSLEDAIEQVQSGEDLIN